MSRHPEEPRPDATEGHRSFKAYLTAVLDRLIERKRATRTAPDPSLARTIAISREVRRTPVEEDS